VGEAAQVAQISNSRVKQLHRCWYWQMLQQESYYWVFWWHMGFGCKT
jgi:hypothetical protein